MDLGCIRHPEEEEYEMVADVWLVSFLSIGLTGRLGVPQAGLRQELRLRLDDEIANSWDLYVAEIEGTIVGLLALRSAESKMDQLFVHPDHQRQGIGHKLLNFAKQKLPLGMWLKAAKLNQNAIGFYLHEGFILDQARSNEDEQKNDVFYCWAP